MAVITPERPDVKDSRQREKEEDPQACHLIEPWASRPLCGEDGMSVLVDAARDVGGCCSVCGRRRCERCRSLT